MSLCHCHCCHCFTRHRHGGLTLRLIPLSICLANACRLTLLPFSRHGADRYAEYYTKITPRYSFNTEFHWCSHINIFAPTRRLVS
jgi:hypothetical protein